MEINALDFDVHPVLSAHISGHMTREIKTHLFRDFDVHPVLSAHIKD